MGSAQVKVEEIFDFVLKRKGRPGLEITHQDRRHLRSGRVTLGVKDGLAADLGSGDEALAHRPRHGVLGELRHFRPVRKRIEVRLGGDVAALELGETVEDGGDLFSRDGSRGREGSVGGSVHHFVLIRPRNGLLVPARLQIGEGGGAGRGGLALGTVQHRYEHGPVHGCVGLKSCVRHAVHEFVFVHVPDGVRVPFSVFHVGEGQSVCINRWGVRFINKVILRILDIRIVLERLDCFMNGDVLHRNTEAIVTLSVGYVLPFRRHGGVDSRIQHFRQSERERNADQFGEFRGGADLRSAVGLLFSQFLKILRINRIQFHSGDVRIRAVKPDEDLVVRD